MGLLDGKVAVITGAGGGLGRAVARAFAAEGASLLVADPGTGLDGGGESREPADAVVDEVRRAGGTALAAYGSVATPAGAETIAGTAERELGGIDVLVNLAGVLRDQTILKVDPESLACVLDVHVAGTAWMVQAAARRMIAQGRGGSIVNTTGLAGLVGNLGQASTAAALAAVYGLTRVAAIELRKHRITVNAIAPVAKTRMTERLPMFEGVSEESLGPAHLAPVAVFLASELARDVTGEVLGVAGGRISRFRVIETAGAFKHDGSWTPQEIRARWSEVTRGS
jgi:NAD(P)-dependent dehydrogenase (short-subunit alcohol dehydrogenase family)